MRPCQRVGQCLCKLGPLQAKSLPGCWCASPSSISPAEPACHWTGSWPVTCQSAYRLLPPLFTLHSAPPHTRSLSQLSPEQAPDSHPFPATPHSLTTPQNPLCAVQGQAGPHAWQGWQGRPQGCAKGQPRQQQQQPQPLPQEAPHSAGGAGQQRAKRALWGWLGPGRPHPGSLGARPGCFLRGLCVVGCPWLLCLQVPGVELWGFVWCKYAAGPPALAMSPSRLCAM